VNAQGFERVLNLYHQAPSPLVGEGLGWYQSAHDHCALLRRKHAPSLSLPQVIGICAALSVGVSWERNKIDLEGFLFAPHRHRCATYGGQVRKAHAIRVLSNPSVSAIARILRGPKTVAFFLNLLGWWHAVTIDRHVIDSWTGCPGASKQATSRDQRRAITAGYRSLARILGITPAQLQAVVWCRWRNLKGL